ncbi:MAG: O-antigen ligase family protein [Patescibacteria group bacterium]
MKYLFLALVFFLPTQLGLHFWPNWAFINGVRIDYFAPTIYLTDLLAAAIVMLNLFQHLRTRSRNKFGMTLWVTVLFALINIYFSISPELSIYKWLKVLEFVWLGLWIKNNFQKSWGEAFVKVLSATIFFQSFLAFGQIITQRSIGGIFYWFGERTFSVATPGIAQAVISGQLFLRPYGTFSHPNVLAAFLLLSIVIIYRLRKNISYKLLVVVYIVASATIILTVSRLPVISLCLFLVWKLGGKKSFFVGLVFVLFFAKDFLLDQSFLIRQSLVSATLEIIKNNLIIGTGLGTNILALQNYSKDLFFNSQPLAFLQPVHNIFLLIFSEIGVFSLVIPAYAGIYLMRSRNKFGMTFLIFIIMFLGLFDHYFVTVQQGQLLLTLVLGIIFWWRNY